MASVRNISVAAGILIILILFGWVFTAPYLSNQGLGRTPGLIIGGTLTDAPADFTIHNDLRGPLKFKLEGFPSMVNYLSWVAWKTVLSQRPGLTEGTGARGSKLVAIRPGSDWEITLTKCRLCRSPAHSIWR